MAIRKTPFYSSRKEDEEEEDKYGYTADDIRKKYGLSGSSESSSTPKKENEQSFRYDMTAADISQKYGFGYTRFSSLSEPEQEAEMAIAGYQKELRDTNRFLNQNMYDTSIPEFGSYMDRAGSVGSEIDSYVDALKKAGVYSDSYNQAFQGIRDSFGNIGSYLDKQYKQSDEYKMLSYDLEAGQKEIDRLKQKEAERNSLRSQLNFLQAGGGSAGSYAAASGMYTDDERKAEIERLQGELAPYANVDTELEQAQSMKYYSENLQKYNEIQNRADFTSNSQYTPTDYENYWSDGAGRTRVDYTARAYEFINNEDRIRSEMDDRNFNGLIEVRQSHLDQMQPNERALFSYIYNTDGPEAASEYLDYIQPELNKRNIQNVASQEQEYAQQNFGTGLLSSIASVPNSLAGGLGALDVTLQNIHRDITGEYRPIDYNTNAMIPSVRAAAAREAVSQSIVNATGVIKINEEEHPYLAKIFNGKSLADVYNLGMSIADSAAAAVFTKGLAKIGVPQKLASGLGSSLLGGNAASQGMIEAIANGATDEQALQLGLMNGLYESLFEAVSIDNLTKDTATGFFKTMLKQGGIEASEEAMTTIANTFADIAIMAENSGYEKNVAAYMEQGMSREEAEKKAFLDSVVQVGWDAFGGFLSGGVSAGGKYAIGSAIQNIQTNEQNKAFYGDYTGSIISDAMELSPENKFVQSMQQKQAEGKELSGREITRLMSENQKATYNAEAGEVRAAAVDSLNDLGETGNVEAIADAITKQVTGEKLTRRDKSVISESQFGSRVASELAAYGFEPTNYYVDISERISAGTINTDASRQSETAGKELQAVPAETEIQDRPQIQEETIRQPDVVSDTPSDVATTEVAEKPKTIDDVANKYGNQAQTVIKAYNLGGGEQDLDLFASAFKTVYDMGTDGVSQEYAMNSDSVKFLTEAQREFAYISGRDFAKNSATLKDSGEFVTVKSIASGSDGNFVFELQDGKKVSADEITLSEGDSLVFNAISNMGVTAKEANNLFRGFKRRTSAERYSAGIEEAYNYGKSGVAYNDMDPAGYASSLRSDVRKYAYNLGKKYSGDTVKAKKEVVQDGEQENVYLRGSEQRVSGADTGRAVSGLEESTESQLPREAEPGKESGKYGPGKAEAEVKQAFASVPGFVYNGEISVVDESYSEDVSEAYSFAKENGMNAVFFVGGNMSIEYDGEIIESRACVVGDDVFVRADHPSVTALQLIKHEDAHRKIRSGEVDPQNVYDMIVSYYGENNVLNVIQAYAEAYNMGHSTQELSNAVFEEIVCDSIAEINYFDIENNLGVSGFMSNVALSSQVDSASRRSQRSALETGGVSLSRESAAEIDSKYLSAVNSNDMEAAQKMVDDFAKDSGYKIKAYHGSYADFTVFDKGKIGKGVDQFGAGFYFASSPETSSLYGDRLYNVYLDIKKPIKIRRTANGGDLYDVEITPSQAYKIVKRHPDMYTEESPLGDFYEEFWEVGAKDWMVRDLAKQYLSIGMLDGDLFRNYPNELHEAVRDVLGYDGVEVSFDNTKDKFYIAWFDNQMKSSEAVVYDDAGKVVPLSSRFDKSKQDIRFSREFVNAQAEESEKISQKANKALSKENERLADENQYLKQLLKMQGKVTKGQKFTRSSVERSARELMKSYSAKGDLKKFADILNDFYEYIAKGDELTWESVMEAAQPAVDWLTANKKTKFVRDPYAQQILDDLKGRGFYLDEAQIAEAKYQFGSYAAFRQKLFGVMPKVGKNSNTSLDEFWAELSAEYPYYFPPYLSASDQVSAVVDAINRLKSAEVESTEESFGVPEEMRNREVLYDVYDSYWDVSTLRTVADVKQKEIDELKSKHFEKMEKIRQYHKESVAKIRSEYRDRIEKLRSEYMERSTKKIQKIKEENRLAKERATKRRAEFAEIKKYRTRIEKDVAEISKWALRPDAKSVEKHIPEAIRSSVIPFLTSIDFSSKSTLSQKAPTYSDYKFSELFEKLKNSIGEYTAENLYSGYADLPLDFMDRLNAFSNSIANFVKTEDSFVINQMDSQQLKALSEIIVNLKTFIQKFNRFHNNAMFRHAYEAGDNTIKFLRSFNKKFNQKSKLGVVSNFMQWQVIRPVFGFDRFGDGGVSIFQEFMAADDKFFKNAQMLFDFVKKTYTEKEAKEWTSTIKTFELESKESVSMPVTFVMSFYCLYKQEASQRHIEGDGIRVATFKKDGEPDPITHDGCILTENDISAILDSLTERQKEVADEIQQFMAMVGSDWGNYVSVARYGEKLFRNPDYFPINADGRNFEATADKQPGVAALYALLNASFTKQRNDKASNRIIVYDIFDVFSNHMARMAQYNAYALPIIDALKWLNYKETKTVQEVTKTGKVKEKVVTTDTLRTQLAKVFGMPVESSGQGKQGYAESFIVNLIKDISGSGPHGTEFDTAGKKFLNRYNRSRVGFNGRVVVQQPVSIIRAAEVISYNSILNAMRSPSVVFKVKKEMLENSGVAYWKSAGFFDVNISKNLVAMMKYESSAVDKITDKAMYLASKADEITWQTLWLACKYEVAKSGIKPSDAKFMEAVNRKFQEVIYRTQVVDSVLVKGEFLRDKGLYAKAAGSFMTESTASYSLLVAANDKIKMEMMRGVKFSDSFKKHRKAIVRTAGVYSLGALLISITTGIYDALRDDDDYQTFMEKWYSAFGGNLVGEIMPFNKIPVVADVYDLVKDLLSRVGILDSYGIAPQRIHMQWYDQLVDAVEILHDRISGEKTNYQWYGGVYKLLDAVSGITGLSIAPLTREAVTIWNNTAGKFNPDLKLKTYEMSKESEIKYAYLDGFLTFDEAVAELLASGKADDNDDAYWTVTRWYHEKENPDDEFSRFGKYFDAVKSGKSTEESLDELFSHGYEEKEIQSALKSEVKKWFQAEEISKDKVSSLLKTHTEMEDDEISKIITKWSCYLATGTHFEEITDKYQEKEITLNKAIEMYRKYGSYTEDTRSGLVSHWSPILQEEYENGKLSRQEVKSLYTKYFWYSSEEAESAVLKYDCEIDTGIAFNDIKDKFVKNKISHSRAVSLYTKYGEYEAEDAEKLVTKWECKKYEKFEYDEMPDKFKDGEINREKAKQVYIKYGGYDEDEAEEEVVVLEFVKENPACDGISYAAVSGYNDYCKKTGVDPATFYDAWKFKNGAKNDYDSDGEVTISKKEKVMDYIDGLNLTKSQKDSLYYACGYAESTLNETPWH